MPTEKQGLPDQFRAQGGKSNLSKQPNFRNLIEQIAQSRGSLIEVFTDFARVSACALAAQTREDEYLEVAGRYSRDELNCFSKAFAALVNEMEANPFTDALGPYYTEVGSKFSRDLRGEFYTPLPVGEAMARMTMDVPAIVATGKPVTVCDPASGSGGLMLSVAKLFAKDKAGDLLRVTCQDISPVACDMAYINMTLWGIPARIVLGDTLRGSVQTEWRNIHWFRVGEPEREQIQAINELCNEASNPSAQKTDSPDSRVEPEPSEPSQSNSGQYEWVFE